MKRMIALAMAGVMLLSMAACTSKQENQTQPSTQQQAAATTVAAKEPVKLVMWGGVPEDKGPKQVAENYSKVNPNVTVEYYRYVNDDNGNIKLDMALAAGEKIDIFVSYTPARRDKRIETNNTADITDLAKKYDIDLVRDFGSIASSSLKDGKVYTIPTMKYMDLIAINKKKFDDAQIKIPTMDSTWGDWRNIAKQLTSGEGANKIFGFIMPNAADFYISNYIFSKYQSGTPWLNSDATASTWKENVDFKNGYQFIKDMMYTDKSMMSWEDMVMQKMDVANNVDQLFFSGKSAAYITGSNMLRNLKDAKTFPHDFVTAFAPIPKVDKDQGKYYAAIQTNDHIAVSQNCSNKEEAVKFIKWYYTEGYDPMIKGGRLPLYQKYDQDKAYQIIAQGAENLIDEESLKATLFGNYTDFRIEGNSKARNDLAKISKEETEAFLVKKGNVDELLDNLQKRSDEALKSAK